MRRESKPTMTALSGARVRRFGLSVSLWAVALAALLDGWQVSFLFGVLLFGIGLGLGDWKGGDC